MAKLNVTSLISLTEPPHKSPLNSSLHIPEVQYGDSNEDTKETEQVTEKPKKDRENIGSDTTESAESNNIQTKGDTEKPDENEKKLIKRHKRES